jgi:lactate racemase
MRLLVEFQEGALEFEGADDRLVGSFAGPPDPPEGDPLDRVRRALEQAVDYPPLRHVVVPGDRVAIPLDAGLPDASLVLSVVAEILRDVGVESIKVLIDGRERGHPRLTLPEGVTLVEHDPSDRNTLAYLATTEAERRIYLNRELAEADCVVPLGRIGPDEAVGLRGPWSVIDFGLSDRVAIPTSLLAPPDPDPAALGESLEVSWLLGSQFQVGVVPGRRGALDIVAGLTTAVRDRGRALLATSWGFAVEDRADLVIAGLGGPGREAHAGELIEALRQAFRVVRRGGKVALLTRLEIGLIREVATGTLLPRGDWEKALAWADVYIASRAKADDLDELGLIPLDRPEQAIKLAAIAPSFLTISQADRVNATLPASKRSRRTRPDGID